MIDYTLSYAEYMRALRDEVEQARKRRGNALEVLYGELESALDTLAGHFEPGMRRIIRRRLRNRLRVPKIVTHFKDHPLFFSYFERGDRSKWFVNIALKDFQKLSECSNEYGNPFTLQMFETCLEGNSRSDSFEFCFQEQRRIVASLLTHTAD